jgi:uncharacterized protein YdhG (YjbR/CyaY superfamily)
MTETKSCLVNTQSKRGDMPKFETVKEYIAAQDLRQQQILMDLRALLHRVAPDAQESLQWGLPTFEAHGVLASLAARKGFVALYFAPDFPQVRVEALGVDCGKSCVRFKNAAVLPTDAIEHLLTEALEWNRTKAAAHG